MTALNKAFIKAYQRHGAGGPHIPLAAAPPRQATSVEQASQAETPIALAPVALAPAAPAPTASAPTRAVAVEKSVVDPVPVVETQTIVDTVADTNQGTESDDRLSAIEYRIDSGVSKPKTDHLRPAFEVEHFDWPATVTSLLERGPEIDMLLSELLPERRGTLVVCGCRRGEGRTSVAMMLARHLAGSGARVAVADADVQRPQLASRLGVTVESGWEECLSRDLAPGEAAIESIADRLTLFPLRETVSAEVLSENGVGLKALVEQWQAEFDILLIDAGPLADSDRTVHESLLAEVQTDAAVVVRDVRHCRPEQAHAVGRKLGQLGVSRWAIVENFCGEPCTKPIGS